MPLGYVKKLEPSAHLPTAIGGDIIFSAGTGGGFHDNDSEPIGGKIIFRLPEGKEFMRIEPDGKCFVNGTLVATDVEAHTGFVNWLRSAGFHL